MDLAPERVAAIAPDAAALATARRLATSNSWRSTSRSDRAAWGECAGSALYQVRADLASLTTKCTCPSRKFPCKHGLALLLRVADGAGVSSDEPDWVLEWFAKRDETAARKATRAERKPAAPRDTAAAAKRAGARHERIVAGLDAFDFWAEDVLRRGFAAAGPAGGLDLGAQAARLVDAQAPGLAGRLRRTSAAVALRARDDETAAGELLGDIAHVALLAHAYRRLDALDAALAADVRAAVGLPLERDEVLATGERVADTWFVLGSLEDDEDRVRSQRTWLRGLRTGRDALVLQFAPGRTPFAETYEATTCFDAELAYWPGAVPQRTLVARREGAARRHDERLDGAADAAAVLAEFAGALARQPWLDRLPVRLHDVALGAPPTWFADTTGARLDLWGSAAWTALACSGGARVDVAGEWDGRRLRPLLWRVDGRWLVAEGTR